MSQPPHSFNEDGARRIVAVVRDVESSDLRSGGPKGRRPAEPAGKQEYIIARVTGVDAADPLRVKVAEQYWSDEENNFIDIPGGRVWDGEDGNLPTVWAGNLPAVGAIVTMGHRHGVDGGQTWFIVLGGSWTFDAKITGNAAMAGETNRWQYAWTEQQKSGTDWADRIDGRSGTTSSHYIINGLELSELAGSPIANDTIVRVHGSIDLSGEVSFVMYAGGGGSLPEPLAKYHVIIALGTGGIDDPLYWASDYPRMVDI